jgi:hypothetical protein
LCNSRIRNDDKNPYGPKELRPLSILPIVGAAALLNPTTPLKAASSAVKGAGSAFAGLLKQAIDRPAPSAPVASASLAASQPQTGNAIDLARLRATNAGKIEHFAAKFRRALQEAGIEPMGDIQLQLDGMGQVRVAGNPFDKQKIESVLASNPELGSQFREIAANAALLQAADEAASCRQNANGDPHSLVADAPNLFARDRAPKFTLNVRPNDVQAAFVAETTSSK